MMRVHPALLLLALAACSRPTGLQPAVLVEDAPGGGKKVSTARYSAAVPAEWAIQENAGVWGGRAGDCLLVVDSRAYPPGDIDLERHEPTTAQALAQDPGLEPGSLRCRRTAANAVFCEGRTRIPSGLRAFEHSAVIRDRWLDSAKILYPPGGACASGRRIAAAVTGVEPARRKG